MKKTKIALIIPALIPLALCALMVFEIIPYRFFEYIQGLLFLAFMGIVIVGLSGG